MPREVASAYLTAAAQAWPFVSEAAFRHVILKLSLTRSYLLHAATKPLANDLEAWLRPRSAGLSLDTLRQIRNHAWFDNCPRDRPLASVLTDLAARILEPRGGQIILARGTASTLSEPLEHWRWLSLLLPPDLLIAALYAPRAAEPPADRVSLVTAQLAETLTERPAAETHLHLGAAIEFSLLWTSLMRSLAHEPPKASDLASSTDSEPPPFGSSERFLAMLFAAGLGRTLLAAFLWRRERTGHPADLSAFFDVDLHAICQRVAWPWGPRDAHRAIRLCVRVLAGDEPSSSWLFSLPRLLALYRRFIGPRLTGTCTSPLNRVVRDDPLAAWVTPATGFALPETRFASRALAYLLGSGCQDAAFATLFWQYERVRSLMYRRLTQSPGTAGLDWFTTYYNRLRVFRSPLKSAQVEAALALESSDLRLGAVEFRSAPETSWASVRNEVRRAASQAVYRKPPLHAGRPEIGLVFHFIKELECGRGRFRRLHADPRQMAHGVRFGAWGYQCLRGALAIEAALERVPEILLVLRGIDIAATELAVPTWATIPIFQRLRVASLRASERLARMRPDWRVPPLRFTCHAGEDYRRLNEGLRRVHELIEFGVLGVGDRIGHGLALGHDPEQWARGATEMPQPAEERLDDLLWELDRYNRCDLNVDSGRYAYVRAEASRIGGGIYGFPINVDALAEARRLRHERRILDRFGYPYGRCFAPSGTVEELVHGHLTNARVFGRGQRLEVVHVDQREINLLRSAQAWVCKQVCRLEMTVESNPSSNLLIGDFLSIEEHPSFRMQPLHGRPPPEHGPILLSINADDPLTFATSLADEFAYVYGALLQSGVAASDALAWLAQRRDQGFRSRFTLPASADPDELRRILPERDRRGSRRP
jgi:hypothetical protein